MIILLWSLTAFYTVGTIYFWIFLWMTYNDGKNLSYDRDKNKKILQENLPFWWCWPMFLVNIVKGMAEFAKEED